MNSKLNRIFEQYTCRIQELPYGLTWKWWILQMNTVDPLVRVQLRHCDWLHLQSNTEVWSFTTWEIWSNRMTTYQNLLLIKTQTHVRPPHHETRLSLCRFSHEYVHKTAGYTKRIQLHLLIHISDPLSHYHPVDSWEDVCPLTHKFLFRFRLHLYQHYRNFNPDRNLIENDLVPC